MYIHIQMNLTMEVLRRGWLLPPYGLSAEVHDSTNSADNPYGGNSQPMRNTSIVKFICICVYIYIYIYIYYTYMVFRRVPSCSVVFRHVPSCSVMFRRGPSCSIVSCQKRAKPVDISKQPNSRNRSTSTCGCFHTLSSLSCFAQFGRCT